MANQIKLERLQSIISRELTLIMQREYSDRLLNSISIHEVKLSADYSHAKIYYSSFISKNKAELDDVVEKYHKDVKSKLAKRIDIHHCPQLEFIYDETLEHANAIENILKNINQEKKSGS